MAKLNIGTAISGLVVQDYGDGNPIINDSNYDYDLFAHDELFYDPEMNWDTEWFECGINLHYEVREGVYDW